MGISERCWCVVAHALLLGAIDLTRPFSVCRFWYWRQLVRKRNLANTLRAVTHTVL